MIQVPLDTDLQGLLMNFPFISQVNLYFLSQIELTNFNPNHSLRYDN